MIEPGASSVRGEDARDERAVEAIDFTEKATCLGCGYRLRELPEPRCPECGRPFDPHDAATMRVPGHPRRPVVTLAQRMIRGGAVAATVVVIGRLMTEPIVLVLGLAIWIPVLAQWGARLLSRGRYPSAPEGAPWRLKVVLLFAITLLLPPRAYTCPHATTVWLGVVGISYSSSNGPCRNRPHCGGVRIIGPWFYAYGSRL